MIEHLETANRRGLCGEAFYSVYSVDRPCSFGLTAKPMCHWPAHPALLFGLARRLVAWKARRVRYASGPYNDDYASSTSLLEPHILTLRPIMLPVILKVAIRGIGAIDP